MKKNVLVSPTRWMYATLPANIASGPLATLVALYIVSLGGGAVAVAGAIALYNAIWIPTAYFFGRMSDSMKRKNIILLSYLGITILILLLLFVNSIAEVTILYALISFMMAAKSTPVNLLAAETSQKEDWAKSFARLQYFSVIGAVIGLILGVYVTGIAGINVLIELLVIASFASVVLTALLVNEPERTKTERMTSFNQIKSIIYDLKLRPIIITSPMKSIRNAIDVRKMKQHYKGYLYKLYLGSFLFYAGSGFFDTQLPVGLKLFGVSSSGVFTILFVATLVQIPAFKIASRFVSQSKRNPMSMIFLVLRSGGYILTGLSFIFLVGQSFFYSNLIFDMIASGIAYAIFYTGFYTMLLNTMKAGSGGKVLGIFSGLSAIAVLLGSFLSGIVSVSFGFGVDFLIAGTLTAVSVYVLGSI